MHKERLKYIDIARAFAIILIVIGHTLVHSANCSVIFKFLYSFHVPLFFILSGYLGIDDKKDIKTFLKNKVIRILIPYFTWATLFLIPYMILGSSVNESIGSTASFDLKTMIFNLLYGNGNGGALRQNSSLWFLTALFMMNVIYYFIIKYLNKKNNKKADAIAFIIILTIGFITNYFLKINLPWGINTVLVGGVFFYIGYLLRKYKVMDNNKVMKYITIIILVIGLASAFINPKTVSYIDYDYGILLLAYLSGTCISIFVIYISKLINANKILEYIGRNTMGILIFHKIIILIFQSKMGVISRLLKSSNIFIELLLTIIISIISIIVSLLITELVRKILPILIGESKK